MPRLTESVPKYRKHKGTRQAVVTINGRDHYLGPHGTKASRLEYDRLISEWLTSGRCPTFGRPEHVITITELIVGYLEYAKGYYGDNPRGEFANMRHALRPMRRVYGNHPANEFGPLQLKAVREKFLATGNSRKHINTQIRRIIRVFRWGVSEGLIPPDVPQTLAMVPGLRRGHTTAPETKKVRPVEEDLIEATLPQLPAVVRAMVKLQWLCGCRPGELVLLRPCDVDRSHDVWEFRPIQHKNSNREQDRCIYLGPQAQEVLRPFQLRPAESFCFSPAETVAQQRAERHENRRTPISCGNTIGTNRKRSPKRKAGERYKAVAIDNGEVCPEVPSGTCPTAFRPQLACGLWAWPLPRR
jgi:integrase